MGVDPEVALNKATDKFIDRFEIVEKSVTEDGMSINDVSSEDLNAIWNEIKHKKQ